MLLGLALGRCRPDRSALPIRPVGLDFGCELSDAQIEWGEEAAVNLNHLYLLVRDLDRSRNFYERYFGFDGPSEWQAETFVVRNSEGFSLALTPDPDPPGWPRQLHFGFLVDDVQAVRSLRARLESDGIEIVESMSQPRCAIFKCLDPDGYVIEVEAGIPSFD